MKHHDTNAAPQHFIAKTKPKVGYKRIFAAIRHFVANQTTKIKALDALELTYSPPQPESSQKDDKPSARETVLETCQHCDDEAHHIGPMR